MKFNFDIRCSTFSVRYYKTLRQVFPHYRHPAAHPERFRRYPQNRRRLVPFMLRKIDEPYGTPNGFFVVTHTNDLSG